MYETSDTQDDVAAVQKLFNPCYYLIVGRHLAWDPGSIKIIEIAHDPAYAYLVYSKLKGVAADTVTEIMWTYFIQDPWGADVVEFCQNYLEKYGVSSKNPEK